MALAHAMGSIGPMAMTVSVLKHGPKEVRALAVEDACPRLWCGRRPPPYDPIAQGRDTLRARHAYLAGTAPSRRPPPGDATARAVTGKDLGARNAQGHRAPAKHLEVCTII